MDLKQALSNLEIDLNETKISNLTPEYIKRRYHKMALLHHPDKNGDTLRFQLINESYEFLMEELKDQESSNTLYNDSTEFTDSNGFSPYTNFETDFTTGNIYADILYSFIEGVIKANTNTFASPSCLIIKVIKEIVLSQVSLFTIFENIDKETSLEIYNFIFKYKHVLHIDSDLVLRIEEIVKGKYANDLIFSLNPSLADVLDNNIYKLYVDGHLYLVPLWHNELYFLQEEQGKSNLEKEIIVLCKPVLPSNVSIDDDNNILLEHSLSLDTIKALFKNKIDTNFYLDIHLGNKVFQIPLQNLYIKKEQQYIFKREGIAQIIENDMYNISCKSDIIVKIILTFE
jgi:hypothetical protein